MLSVSSISTKKLVTAIIIVLALFSIALALLISAQFKVSAFESKKEISSQFIEVTAKEAFKDLNDTLFNLGTELQSDKELRKLLKSVIARKEPAESLEIKLNESFSRRFHTAGLIELEKIRLYDKDMKYITSSSQGKSNLGVDINDNFKARALVREGADRLKMISQLWASKKDSHYSKLIHIGGFRVSGYLEIVVNPAHNLKVIEELLDTPIDIHNLNTESTYKSETWPNDLSNYVVADFFFDDIEGNKILGIEAAFDNSKFTSEIDSKRTFALVTFIIFSLVFIFIVSAFLNKTLFGPLETFVGEIREASSGNLLVEIDKYGVKEAHLLSVNLEEFVISLRENVKIILDNSTHLNSSAKSLSQSAEKNKNGIYVQQLQTEQAATAMNEMSITVAEVARSTADAAKAAANSQDKSLLGKKSVDNVIGTMNQLSNNIQESESLIEDLNKESKAIGAILDVITSISEQTNLLALNAAIEASRAGEAGRGFAVVADEVRTLANKTQESASDIRKMVESLQQGTHNAVESMTTSRNTAEQAVNEISVAGGAIDEVTDAVNLMSDINAQIATAAEEQSAVAEEINQNIIKIKDIGTDNTEVANTTAEEGVNMLQVSEILSDSVKRFKT